MSAQRSDRSNAVRDFPSAAHTPRGAALVGLLRGGPADRAGLRAADIVVAITGKPLADTAALVAETAALSPGTRVQFKVLRGGETLTIGVELGQRPPPPMQQAPR